ncbi:hypothetical protein EGH55_05860 [Klebsiella aerogenes]|nr:hypothetical protein EGH55_05860 [Klebsiella aerogenes]
MSSVWLALAVFSIPIAISILCCLKNTALGISETHTMKNNVFTLPSAQIINNQQRIIKSTSDETGGMGKKKPPCDWR